MTRLTGNDALGLMEAYNAVYAQEELTEEQIQEDFKNWVYSLVEEGYDLSEYSWDDMYEGYLAEMQGSQNRDALTMNPNWQRNLVGPKIVGPGKVGPKIVGRGIVGPKIVGIPNRPYDAIPGVRAVRQWASDNANAERQDALNRTPRSRQESLRQMELNRTRRLRESVDQYDLIFGYLLDEGYADTEQDALVIMSNMSEDWKESIVEGIMNAVGNAVRRINPYDAAQAAGTVAGNVQRAVGNVQRTASSLANTFNTARQGAATGRGVESNRAGGIQVRGNARLYPPSSR